MHRFSTSFWQRTSILTSLAVNITGMTNTYNCEYSIETPDDGQ